MKSNNILILGARSPACLEWSRMLSQAGHTVYVADSMRCPLTRASKYVVNYKYLPPVAQAHETWLQELIKHIQQHKINYLLPTCEEVFYVAHYLAKLQQHCQVFTSPLTILKTLHHKYQFAELTQQWSIKAPKTMLLTSQLDLQQCDVDWSDWVLKPAFSRFATATIIQPKTDDLLTIEPTTALPYVAQKYIAGQEYCSFSLFQQGKLLANVVYQPCYRAGQGAGIYFVATEFPALTNFLIEFGQTTGYTGQVGFDFMLDAQQKFHVLECNPRATSGIHFFSHNGADIGASLFDGQPTTIALEDVKPKMLAFALLYYYWPRVLSAQFRQDFRRAQDVIWQRHDLKVAFMQPISLLELIWRAVKNRGSILASTTYDIAWNGNALTKL